MFTEIQDPFFARVRRNPFPPSDHFKDPVELSDVEDESVYTIEYDPINKKTTTKTRLDVVRIDHPTFWNNKKL